MATLTSDKLSPFVAASAALHGALFVLALFAPAWFPASTATPWGSSANTGVKVGVVSSLPGIPLPSPPVVQESAKPNASKTLNPAETAPKAAVKAPVKADVQIPARGVKPDPKRTPPADRTASNADPAPESTPSNTIPGAGGQIALPYGQLSGGGAQATFGDGNFGARFPEYVNSMVRAIELRWRDTIASVPRGSSPRVYVTFTLNRGGKPQNLQVSESSGSLALDNSAQRAVLGASIPPLPSGYSGSTVDVRFYFEYKR